MYIRVKIGKYKGEVKFFRNDIARQMLQDGRAELPTAEIETTAKDLVIETATKKKRRRRRRKVK